MTDIFTSEIPELLQTHYEQLHSSSISDDVIRERGYVSVLGKTPLRESRFSRAQQRTPGILIPLYGTDGTVIGHQYRPDNPRTGQRGRLIKYENPAGSTVHLDIPPRCRENLGAPDVPIWFTEGVKKVDALASAGACAVGLTGVWGFKGKNVLGGTTILADFDYITLKGRLAYLVFDSDSAGNPHVTSALRRLAEHLYRKGANVKVLHLPSGQNGEKTGADDYLSQGHTLSDMVSLEVEVTDEYPARVDLSSGRESTPYCITDGRICWLKKGQDGTNEVPLCNFTANITSEVLRDNGVERGLYFKIAGKHSDGTELPEIEVPTSSFNSLGWVTSEWGGRPIIAAGQSSKDRLREAIQLLSQGLKQETIFTHTGWREVDGEMVFLSGAGAIGRPDIYVELEGALERYQLLREPFNDPAAAVKASFDFIFLAEPEVTIPLFAGMYLAPLSEIIDPAFTIWLVGASGTFKSTLTALALSHFGNFDELHLPASWRDTHNQLEKLLFLTKDLPLVIDDWAPGADTAKARELEVKAEYIVRAQGNRQGRGRMRVDTSSRPNYIPRGLLLTSGEQLPSGHSHTARIYAVELEGGDINRDLLTEAQRNRFLYCAAMTEYITWLQQNWNDIRTSLKVKWEQYRTQAIQENQHTRLPGVVASLYVATETASVFAVERGYQEQSSADALLSTAWDILTKLAADQAERVSVERPATRFLDAIRAMFSQGKAVLSSKDDESPRVPAPGTTPVGWIENTDDGKAFVLLNPKAAYGAVYEYSQRTGTPFTFKEQAVWKDLDRLGLITHTNGRFASTARIYGDVKRVIKVKYGSLMND